MGLITSLLTLPLAPVRGTVWLAERIQEQAEGELYDESAILAQLIELDDARASSALPGDDIDAAEDELLERLMAMRGYGAEGTNGEGK